MEECVDLNLETTKGNAVILRRGRFMTKEVVEGRPPVDRQIQKRTGTNWRRKRNHIFFPSVIWFSKLCKFYVVVCLFWRFHSVILLSLPAQVSPSSTLARLHLISSLLLTVPPFLSSQTSSSPSPLPCSGSRPFTKLDGFYCVSDGLAESSKLRSCSVPLFLIASLLSLLLVFISGMGLLSTILGILGFGIGIPIGLLVGFFLFMYDMPKDVEVMLPYHCSAH